jgi:hypothetical protein
LNGWILSRQGLEKNGFSLLTYQRKTLLFSLFLPKERKNNTKNENEFSFLRKRMENILAFYWNLSECK